MNTLVGLLLLLAVFGLFIQVLIGSRTDKPVKSKVKYKPENRLIIKNHNVIEHDMVDLHGNIDRYRPPPLPEVSVIPTLNDKVG
jgi:hypothetical protein